MNRHFRFSFICVVTLMLAVAFSSCSKKDVVSDEPAINPSDMGGAAAAAPEGADTTEVGGGEASSAGAGDIGMAAADLRIVYFAFDSYALTGDARGALKGNADWLKANPSARVQIEGHCDERGTTEYNMALGDRRANAVKGYLSKLGVDKSRMETISYGEERPSDPGHDEAGWAKNRRAVFVTLTR
jgi:peptidoglycan-associated lipoprotein